jgi:hypothetical protein
MKDRLTPLFVHRVNAVETKKDQLEAATIETGEFPCVTYPDVNVWIPLPTGYDHRF